MIGLFFCLKYKEEIGDKKEIKKELDVLELFHNMLDETGEEWDNPDLMLYTIIELISSTCHSIILRSYPVDLETYKPYLHKCIAAIVGVNRIQA